MAAETQKDVGPDAETQRVGVFEGNGQDEWSKWVEEQEKALQAEGLQTNPQDAADQDATNLELAATQGLDIRSKYGQQFSRDKEHGGASTAYKACKTHSAKKEFRKKWAAFKAEEIRSERIQTETLSETDKRKGTMRSMAWLIKKEGEDKARRYAQKCIALGPQWYEWESMWEHYEFLVYEKSCSHIFTRAWQLRERRIAELQASKREGAAPVTNEVGWFRVPSTSAPSAAAAPAEEPEIQEPNHKAARTDPNDGDKGQGKGSKGENGAKGKGEGSKGKDGAKGKGKGRQTFSPMVVATKTKNNYIKVVAGASNLQDIIAKSAPGEAWSWAKNSDQLEPFESSYKDLKVEVENNVFHQCFMTHNPTEVKRQYPDQKVLDKELLAMAGRLQPLIDKVATYTCTLVSMHTAKLRALSSG